MDERPQSASCSRDDRRPGCAIRPSDTDIISNGDGTARRSPPDDRTPAHPSSYTGIEAGLCHAMHYGPQRFKEVLKAHDMDLILMLFTSGPACPARYGIPGHSMDARDVQTHLTLFKEQAREAYDTFGDITLFCNSHSINDYFSWDEAHAFFDEALAFQEAEGLEVYHETHRKRWLHSPWVTRQFIQTYPQMKLVADLSHWINVAETDTVSLCATCTERRGTAASRCACGGAAPGTT